MAKLRKSCGRSLELTRSSTIVGRDSSKGCSLVDLCRFPAAELVTPEAVLGPAEAVLGPAEAVLGPGASGSPEPELVWKRRGVITLVLNSSTTVVVGSSDMTLVAVPFAEGQVARLAGSAGVGGSPSPLPWSLTMWRLRIFIQSVSQ